MNRRNLVAPLLVTAALMAPVSLFAQQSGATIITTVRDRVVQTYTIECHGRPPFTIDILGLPDEAYTNEFIDTLDRLVGTFESENGIELSSGLGIDPKTKKMTADLIATVSEGTAGAAPLCEFLSKYKE